MITSMIEQIIKRRALNSVTPGNRMQSQTRNRIEKLTDRQVEKSAGMCSAPRTILVAFALNFLWHSDVEPMTVQIIDQDSDWLYHGSSLLLFLIHAFIYWCINAIRSFLSSWSYALPLLLDEDIYYWIIHYGVYSTVFHLRFCPHLPLDGRA